MKKAGQLVDKPMENKNRSSYPMTGGISGIPRDEEEAEMRSPMIDRHQSYQSPFNIR